MTPQHKRMKETFNFKIAVGGEDLRKLFTEAVSYLPESNPSAISELERAIEARIRLRAARALVALAERETKEAFSALRVKVKSQWSEVEIPDETRRLLLVF